MHRLRPLFVVSVLLAPCHAFANAPASVSELLHSHRFEILADPAVSDVPLEPDEAHASADAVWQAYQREQSESPTLTEADRSHVVHYGDHAMRYHFGVVGQPGPAGYPLYIALHGGGSAPPYVNDNQWEHMRTYYKSSLKSGIYVAPRAISDTWDMHFQPASYHLYKKLIGQMVVLHGVDPDRVYLLGFSAGGDGVYQVAPRISDKLAAANMSAGHPNDVSLVNLLHVPMLLQVGEQDSAYNRNHVTVEYAAKLASLRAAHPTGYEHENFVHAGKGHNFYDNDDHQTPQPVLADPQAWLRNGQRTIAARNTNAIAWLEQFSRDPRPTDVEWDLTTVVEAHDNDAPLQHHWLDIGQHTAQSLGTQRVRASIDTTHNAIHVEGARTYLKIWIDSRMLDLRAPVRIVMPSETKELTLAANVKYQIQSVLQRSDPQTVFDAAIELHETPWGWEATAP